MYKTVHLYAKIVAFLCGLLYKYKPFVQPSKEKPRKMYKTPIKQALLGLFFMLQRDLPKAYLHLPTVSFIATKNNLKNAIFKVRATLRTTLRTTKNTFFLLCILPIQTFL